MEKIRAVWENGHLRVLDNVQLVEGTQVIISIEPQQADDWLHSVLGANARFPEITDTVDDEHSQLEINHLVGEQNIDASTAIIEDREDRF